MVANIKIIGKHDTEKIHSFVEKHLTPKSFEKKEFGEVFTPLSLVEEMMTSLTKYANKTFWSNPNIKILDPAAGIGNFPLIAYKKLMEGLRKVIQNEEKRRQHIFENMLYMVELNPTNVKQIKKMFNYKDYKLNIIQGDFLASSTHEKMKKTWEMQELKFDMVMGNPPWQDSVQGKRKGGYGGKKPLWEKFVKVILPDFIKPNGYLVFIHPPSWRKPGHDLWELMSNYQMLYLNINGETQSKQVFKVNQRYDWYILKTSLKNIQTTINDELNDTIKIYMKRWPFIPNYHFPLVRKLIASTGEKTCVVLYNTKYHTQNKELMSLKKSNKHKYPCIHTMNNEGIGLSYAKEDKGHFGIPKVILSFGRYQYPFNDYKGERCMTQITYGIVSSGKKECDEIMEAFKKDTFKDLIKATKWSTFITDWRMFTYFKRNFWEYL
jgi:tRNA1(Val) A37 N6-methylase TrmN6